MGAPPLPPCRGERQTGGRASTIRYLAVGCDRDRGRECTRFRAIALARRMHAEEVFFDRDDAISADPLGATENCLFVFHSKGFGLDACVRRIAGDEAQRRRRRRSSLVEDGDLVGMSSSALLGLAACLAALLAHGAAVAAVLPGVRAPVRVLALIRTCGPLVVALASASACLWALWMCCKKGCFPQAINCCKFVVNLCFKRMFVCVCVCVCYCMKIRNA